MQADQSRRQLLKSGAALAAATALPAIVAAQGDERPAAPPFLLEDIQKQLAKPLSDEAKKLLADAVKNSRGNSDDRLKHKLTENSEPAMRFVPSGRERTSA